jgi:cyanophycin synthetase
MMEKIFGFVGRLYVLALKLWRQAKGQTNQIEFEERVPDYKRVWQEAAERIGAEFLELDQDLWEVRRSGTRTRIANHRLQFDDPVTLSVAGRKTLVYRLLQKEGIPVPDYKTFTLGKIKEAREFLAGFPEGGVIKPERGFGGKGVTTHITDGSQVRRAALLASLYFPRFIVEPHIYGECARILVLNGEVIHAVRRPGIRVTGNGQDSIAALYAALESLPAIEAEKRLKGDHDVQFCLRHLGLTTASVPAAGEEILIKSRKEFLSIAYEQRTAYQEDVTDAICPALRETAEKAAKLVGSDLIGIDIITPDISKSLEAAGGVVNEANTTPAMHHHFQQESDFARGIPAMVLDCLLSEAEEPGHAQRSLRRA